MMNLNSKEFMAEVPKIFNKGNAGRVENVSVKIEDKEVGSPDNYPDYKVIFTDVDGNSLNEGFYIENVRDSYDQTKKDQMIHTNITRILQILRGLVGDEFIIPNLGETYKEVIPELFKLIKANAGGKFVNIFVTYGSKQRPNKKGYMGLRYFGQIVEPTSVLKENTQLFAKPSDLMERIVPNIEKEDEAKTAEDFFS